ncbi:MAG: hypothetical protein LW645_02055 [Verrucomicrobiaceae bacterium]|nr:hypothetical protein [Verrucomicrobiaceae bacterium]
MSTPTTSHACAKAQGTALFKRLWAVANRYDGLPRVIIDRAIWSSSLTSTSMEDTAVMGEIVFE